MQLTQLLEATADSGTQTVPDKLLGCWRRNWIRFGPDGELERDVAVIWLQTPSGMGDLRIAPGQRPGEGDSSCGITVVDESTRPHPTAAWPAGETGFAEQAISSFPEKGWLDWVSDSILHELAPSGAYVEEWEKVEGSNGLTAHFTSLDGPQRTNLYVAGRHYVLAVERASDADLHEFSYGVQLQGMESVTIELSTRADQVGQTMDLDQTWHLVTARSA